MRTVLSLVLSGLFVAALAACSTSEGESPLAPRSEIAPAAAGSGAMIIRTPTTAFVVHLDAERELLSVHAPSTLCVSGGVNVAEAQFVINPAEIGQFIALLKDEDAAVSIYRASSFAGTGLDGAFDFAGFPDLVDGVALCSFLAGPDRIAEGTVRRVSNLSNASFSVSWTGWIESADGDPIKLTEVYQLKADARNPGDSDEWRVNASKILLSPRR